MKFTVAAALLGLTQGVQISNEMRSKQADKMHELCKSVHGIEYPHNSVLVQLESDMLPIAEKRSSDAGAAAPQAAATNTTTPTVTPTPAPAAEAKDNIEGSYK